MNQEQAKTVLVVDDEKHLRDIVKFDLRKSGLRLLEAENGREARAIANREAIDLVISDVRMPEATGIQLLQELRDENPGHPPFVFMTAFSDISSEEALAMGAEAFLRKPVSKQELIDVVTRALVPRAERWARVDVPGEAARRFDVTLTPGGAAAGEAQPPRVEVGQGGMFLAIAEDFPSSFEVLNFKVDSGDVSLGTLEGLGQVLWVRHEARGDRLGGIGVEFLRLEETARDKVLRYLRAKGPKAFIPLGTA